MWTDKSIHKNTKDTGMQQSNMEDTADKMCDMIMDYFKDRVDGFIIKDVYDNEREKMLSVCFRAYNYFPVVVRYDRGRMGCFIDYGSSIILLDSSQKSSYNPDITNIFTELLN